MIFQQFSNEERRPNIFEQIEQEQRERQMQYAEPLNNELEKLAGELDDSIKAHKQTEVALVEEEKKATTFESVMEEISDHERLMEVAIKDADELSHAAKSAVMRFLDERKPNKNAILMNGIPDVLTATSKLLDLSINGRYKLASMKKLRASILKDSLGGKNDGTDINLAFLLGGD